MEEESGKEEYKNGDINVIESDGVEEDSLDENKNEK